MDEKTKTKFAQGKKKIEKKNRGRQNVPQKYLLS